MKYIGHTTNPTSKEKPNTLNMKDAIDSPTTILTLSFDNSGDLTLVFLISLFETKLTMRSH